MSQEHNAEFQLPEVEKAAEVLDSLYANDSLKEVLSQSEIPTFQQDESVGIKQAAYALAQDPSLYASVLAVKAAEAEAIAEHESELLESGEYDE